MKAVLLIVSALALLTGVGFFLLMRTAPPPRETAVAEPAAPAPAPPVRSAPPPAVAEPEPVVRTPTPEPTPEPAPKPEPAVVEAVAVGTLSIESDVPGAQVFLDRVFIGGAPITANDVTLGTHSLNVSAKGYEGIAETIDVEPGPRDILIRFREVRLDLAIEVVHKHRMGSCTGRLTANPHEVRYETANENDGFTVGIMDLEAFEVDYLDKNLKVKPAKGRQYNFTDPEENADRLFVFHRDVEKARDRLRKGDTPAAR